MKHSLILAVLIVVSSVAVVGQSKAETEVRDTITMWADAVKSRDMSALDKLFAEDLFITTYDGKTRGKTEELEALKPSPELKTVSVDNEDIRIKIYAKTAIVTALTKMHFAIGGKDIHVSLRYTAFFVKRDGRWQMVALQTARVPPGKVS